METYDCLTVSFKLKGKRQLAVEIDRIQKTVTFTVVDGSTEIFLDGWTQKDLTDLRGVLDVGAEVLEKEKQNG